MSFEPDHPVDEQYRGHHPAAIERPPPPVWVWDIEPPAPAPVHMEHNSTSVQPPKLAGRQTPATDMELPRLNTRTLAMLTRQLAALLKAGMPVVPALSALAEQEDHPATARLLTAIRDQIVAGHDLAGALSRYPALFSPLYIGMTQAGQAGGKLDLALLKLADILEKRAALESKLRATITYPVFLAFMATGVIIFLLVTVVPGITRIFQEMKQDLPLLTRLLIGVSNFTQHYLTLMAVIIAAAGAGLYAWARSPSGSLALDRLCLKLPLVGKLALQVETTRFARTFALLLSSGLPAVQALELARKVIQNRHIFQSLAQAANAIERGSSVAQAIRQAGIFPSLLMHAIDTGERSGDIETPLTSLADIFDNEIENSARSLTTLIEPVVLLVMGGVIGFIVMAVLLPIFQINQSF